MRLAQFSTLAAIVYTLISPASVQAVGQADYDLRGTQTELWDHDVDYFAPPLKIRRTKDTYGTHYLNFQVLRYVAECLYWQQVCVGYNGAGQCIAWENRCMQWDLRSYPIGRRIELNFHSLPALTGTEEEIYEISIDRQRPSGQGDDRVYTWLREVSTVKPVKILKLGDFRYSIQPKAN